jgi:O-antigen ligase
MPVTISVSLLFAALFAGALFAWFLSLERAGRSVIVVLTILGLVVIETVLYSSQNAIPSGLFHPSGGDFSLRLLDVVIPLALAARVAGRGIGRRMDATWFWWAVFVIWLMVAGVMGVLAGNDRELLAYEAKAIMYLGVFVLAAGVRPEEYLEHRRLDRFLYGASLLAAITIVMDRGELRLHIDNPVLPLDNAGTLAADAGTVLGSLGVVALALAVCRTERRLGLLFASAPLLYAAAISDQRAAVLGVGVAMGMLVILCALRPQRVKATPTEVGLVLLVVVGLFMLPPFVNAVAGEPEVRAPLVTTIERTFGGEGNQLSAESRVDQWRTARIIIAERPFLGSGLGATYSFWDPGPETFIETNLTHEIYLDLWLRTGIIGLVFFVIASLLTIRGGVRTWWRGADIDVASFAAGMTAVFVGLLGKGLVESLFEKYRLATFMGLVIGMVCSAIPAHARLRAREPVVEGSQALQWS